MAKLIGIVVLAAFSHCVRVQAFERAALAQPALQEPALPLLHARQQHTFQTREATRGATGAAGGGCGCL